MALTQVSSDGIKNLNVKTADLENSGVTAGTYGSASLIPALVIDAKGRVTSASTNAITQVGGSNGVDFNDNVKALFGTGSDLEIYHDGSNSLIVDNGTGGLILGVAGTGTSGFYKGTGQEPLATFEPDGPVSLYYNNSKKLETDVSGVTITGRLETTSNVKAKQDGIGFRSGASDDLKLYHDGTDSYLQNDTGNLFIRGNGDDIFLKAVNTEDSLICRPNAGVELFYNNSKKFETTSAGVTIHSSDDGTTGVKGDFRFMQAGSNNTIITFDGSTSALKFEDSRKAVFGAGDDLTIKHHGGDSYLDNQTGTLYVLSDAFTVNNAANGENMIKATANGAVELYYDDSKKFETTANGVEITDSLFLGGKIDMPDHTSGTNGMILLGTGDDLLMYHDGTNSHLRNNTGTFNIRAGSFRITDAAIQHVYLNANGSGNDEIALYYDNSKKLETLSDGVNITGTLKVNGSAISAGGGLFSSYAIIADRKSNGTQGGGSGGPNAWFVRDLNTEITDPDSIVSISSNQFTLAAGTYLIKWRCPASRVKTFMTALYNATDSSYTEYGQTGYSDLSDGSNDYGTGLARVTISGSKAFEIKMIVEDNDSNAASALGRNTHSNLTNFSGNETYTVVEIYKES